MYWKGGKIFLCLASAFLVTFPWEPFCNFRMLSYYGMYSTVGYIQLVCMYVPNVLLSGRRCRSRKWHIEFSMARRRKEGGWKKAKVKGV